ncbi:MAG: hypothetical protein ACFB22_03345 [Rhodothalassiaceae bacterium]
MIRLAGKHLLLLLVLLGTGLLLGLDRHFTNKSMRDMLIDEVKEEARTFDILYISGNTTDGTPQTLLESASAKFLNGFNQALRQQLRQAGSSQVEFSIKQNNYRLIYEQEYLGGDAPTCNPLSDLPLDNVVAVIGPMTTDCAKSLFTHLPPDIPILSPAATMEGLPALGGGRFFRTVLPDSRWSRELVRELADLEGGFAFQRPLILYDEDGSFATKLAANLSQALAQQLGVAAVPALNLAEARACLNTPEGAGCPDVLRRDLVNHVYLVPRPSRAVRERFEGLVTRIGGAALRVIAIGEPAAFDFLDPGSLTITHPSFELFESAASMETVRGMRLSDYRSSAYFAAEALFHTVPLKRMDSAQAMRAALLTNLRRTGFRSRLTGHQHQFRAGEMSALDAYSVEIREITPQSVVVNNKTAQFMVSVASSDCSGSLTEHCTESLFGRPEDVKFTAHSAPGVGQIMVVETYEAAGWVRPIFKLLGLESAREKGYRIGLDDSGSGRHRFFPMWPGTYDFEVGELRFSANGAQSEDFIPLNMGLQLDVGIPRLLLVSLAVSCIVATLLKEWKHARLSQMQVFTGALIASLFLHFLSVTLKIPETSVLPLISFSENDMTNAVYYGMVAGAMRLQFLRLLIEKAVGIEDPPAAAPLQPGE